MLVFVFPLVAVVIFHFLHGLLGVLWVGRHAAEYGIPHGDGSLERFLRAIVQFIGKILRNHHTFAADADSPSEERSLFQRVSRYVLYAVGHGHSNRLCDLSLKAGLF